ncbi:hypothetical protein Syun_026576 [Stephania yunnanensis]|uniref:Cathepsin propeptide inhibitor domain-containing protein n=1 Tax=Stephania yunnanensis TaxID=152371 RepID=A0AAP0ETR4_9MAGN
MAPSLLLLFFAALIRLLRGRTVSVRLRRREPHPDWYRGGFRDLEASVREIVGDTRHALAFARFAHRGTGAWRKIRRRFENFVESLETVKATNKKGLAYRLALNKFADKGAGEEFQAQKLRAPQNCSATTKSTHKLKEGIPSSPNQSLLEGRWHSSVQLKIKGIAAHAGLSGKDGSCKFNAENIAVKVFNSVNITLVSIE